MDIPVHPGDRDRMFFCSQCLLKGYDFFDPPFCMICGRKDRIQPVPDPVCSDCTSRPPAMGSVRAAFVYGGIVRECIHRFKYNSTLRAAAFLGPALFDAFVRYFYPFQIDLILPVPLHVSKLKNRGFNQSYLLIRHFTKYHVRRYGLKPSWKVDPYCMVRKKKTLSQTGFDPVQRKQNIRDAFAVPRPGRIAGKKVLLVDDVFTTGATAQEAAATLMDAGASSVDVLVLARA
jgi:ComF family protein